MFKKSCALIFEAIFCLAYSIMIVMRIRGTFKMNSFRRQKEQKAKFIVEVRHLQSRNVRVSSLVLEGQAPMGN